MHRPTYLRAHRHATVHSYAGSGGYGEVDSAYVGISAYSGVSVDGNRYDVSDARETRWRVGSSRSSCLVRRRPKTRASISWQHRCVTGDVFKLEREDLKNV